jgi:hypothetical protein
MGAGGKRLKRIGRFCWKRGEWDRVLLVNPADPMQGVQIRPLEPPDKATHLDA